MKCDGSVYDVVNNSSQGPWQGVQGQLLLLVPLFPKIKRNVLYTVFDPLFHLNGSQVEISE